MRGSASRPGNGGFKGNSAPRRQPFAPWTASAAHGRSLGPAYVRGSDRLTRRVNAAIEVAAHAAGARYIDGYRPFKGAGSRDCTALLAADGDHPNAAGHEVLARSLVAQLGRLARRL